MKLIVGLGNPGPKYQLTRHNIGFMVIDALAQGQGHFREEHKAEVLKVGTGDRQVLFVKPQTFMNLSGESVRPLADFYKIDLADILVVHDEVDIPFRSLRFQTRRGAGGHNGIRSLHQHLGSDAYARLKVGVGRPTDGHTQVADHVLQPFSKEEFKVMPDYLATCCEAVNFFIQHGIERAATEYNKT